MPFEPRNDIELQGTKVTPKPKLTLELLAVVGVLGDGEGLEEGAHHLR